VRTDVRDTRTALTGLLNSLSTDLASTRSSIESRMGTLEGNVLRDLRGVNASLSRDISGAVTSISSGLTALNGSLSATLSEGFADVLADSNAMEAWLLTALASLGDELAAANASLAASIAGLAADMDAMRAQLTADLVDVMVALALMESNLTVAEGQTRDDIAAVSALVQALHDATLAELGTALDGIASDLADHDAALAARMSSMAATVRQFESNATARIDSIDRTLEDLAKLDAIITNVTRLDTDLAQAQSEIQGDVQSAKDEQMGLGRVNLVLVVVVILLAALVLVLLVRRRGPARGAPAAPAGGIKDDELEPVDMEHEG